MNPAPQQNRPVATQNQQQFKLKSRKVRDGYHSKNSFKREAVQKYEPEAFRDNLFALISTIDKKDNDSFTSVLEANESKLDLKRYAEPFFELFIVGDLLGPGGTSSSKEKFPFAIFETPLNEIKSRVDIISNMARRLKYLPKNLEETVGHLLTYINKYGENMKKLAGAVGLFASSGLINLSVLSKTLKDHLVNDGTCLSFLCLAFQFYLNDQKVEHLTFSLKKADMDWRLTEFFPPQKRNTLDLIKTFKEQNLAGLADYFVKQQNLAVKDETSVTIKEMITSNKSSKEVADFLKKKSQENSWREPEIPSLLWDAIIGSVDWGSRMDQLENTLQKVLTIWIPTIAVFSSASAKSQLSLLLHIQSFCYDDSRFLKHFRLIVQLLYKFDAISESAVLYWYSKGASAHGKKVFLSQIEPFITWLNEQEADESEDD